LSNTPFRGELAFSRTSQSSAPFREEQEQRLAIICDGSAHFLGVLTIILVTESLGVAGVDCERKDSESVQSVRD
jgi:hypothetical protein